MLYYIYIYLQNKVVSITFSAQIGVNYAIYICCFCFSLLIIVMLLSNIYAFRLPRATLQYSMFPLPCTPLQCTTLHLLAFESVHIPNEEFY